MTLRSLLYAGLYAAGVGLIVGVAQADTSPAEAARAAVARLEAAAVQMQVAEDARDRVAALTETVQAYEEGLSAMRDGLRRATIREAQIARQLNAQEAEISRLLGVLQSMGSGPPPVLLLHPSGPEGTARSGMILADIAPALDQQARALAADLEEVAILRSLQQSAADTLQQGLTGAQNARTALSQAIAERTDLPLRFVEDPVKTALLIASTETLEGFASGLSELHEDSGEIAPFADLLHRRGSLPLPVQAAILRRFGESDAAGVARPGLVLATRANALVTSPVAATIRYRGPLLDYGNVIILEPQPGVMFVFAGIGTVFGTTGEVIAEGTALGLMGGDAPEAGAILSQSSDASGQERSETLYIEVREDKATVDPETWFQTIEDG